MFNSQINPNSSSFQNCNNNLLTKTKTPLIIKKIKEKYLENENLVVERKQKDVLEAELIELKEIVISEKTNQIKIRANISRT